MQQQKTYPLAFSMTMFSFFMLGFLTCMNDILIPHLKALFNLNYSEAMLVQFCFFTTYAVMSFPLAKLVNKIDYKLSLVIGFIVAGIGCLFFIPAARLGRYDVFLFGLFVIATGVVMLQVVANPYATLLGPSETASRRLTLTQAFNSLATMIAPLFGAFLILSSNDGTRAQMVKAIEMPYLILAGIAFAMSIIIALFKLPKRSELTDSSTIETNTELTKKSIWQYPHLLLGCVGIFVYVGAEVSIGSFLVNYLQLPIVGNISAETAGKYLSIYWGGAMVGRFIGVVLMSKLRPSKLLCFNAIIAAALVIITMLSTHSIAMWSILFVGLFNSIMFPTIFSLAVKDLKTLTNIGSGLLCMSIVGGAIIPVLQGILADHIGIHHAFILPVLCYLYILFYGLKGHKIGSVTY